MSNPILLAALFQVPGMVIGLFMLICPNPHLLALFAFLGVPLILIGLILYVVTVLREMRRSHLL